MSCSEVFLFHELFGPLKVLLKIVSVSVIALIGLKILSNLVSGQNPLLASNC